MDINNVTTQYYANWLGVTQEQMKNQGLIFICSHERDIIQKGYSQPFDLYVWVTDVLTIVSYGSKLKDNIEQIKSIKHGMTADGISSLILSTYGVKPNRGIKFIFNKQIPNIPNADMLTRDDYLLYHAFFLANHPNCKDTSWLKEYFYEMVDKELCYGIKVNGILISANDLPDMPYMERIVQEIGINTLNDYKGKGYAKIVCSSCISKMLERNICPQWSTAHGNTASEKLAYSIGFQKLSDTITISL